MNNTRPPILVFRPSQLVDHDSLAVALEAALGFMQRYSEIDRFGNPAEVRIAHRQLRDLREQERRSLQPAEN